MLLYLSRFKKISVIALLLVLSYSNLTGQEADSIFIERDRNLDWIAALHNDDLRIGMFVLKRESNVTLHGH